jgi:1,4-dihydroxy-2-naphthoyl-CoA hydrolase
MSILEDLNNRGKGSLPGLLGIEILSIDGGTLTSRLKIRPELMAPNGFLHAASVIALADTTCGYGSVSNLPPSAHGFTTIELKSNFMGTAREGAVSCEAKLVHAGRSTQLWDAVVKDDSSGKVICLFRCTQMILYKS